MTVFGTQINPELLVGLLAVAVAIAALWIETKRSRKTQQVDIILRLSDKFNSSEMRAIRRIAASKLIQKNDRNDELSDVLDFFTVIATLVERNALDTKLTFSMAEYWASRYWYCATEHVENERRYDPDSWKILEKIVEKKFWKNYDKQIRSIIRKPQYLAKFLKKESETGDGR